jgi:molybdopterin converting factor subunit 1
MILHIHLFAGAKDLAGADTLTVELTEGATVADLFNVLCRNQPRLAALLEHSAVAVNAELARPDLRLTPKDEIALLPPVSGG